MKKTFLNLLAVASVITTASLLLDSDPREPSTIMRFVEYILMLAIFFTIVSGIYFGTKAIVNRFKLAR